VLFVAFWTHYEHPQSDDRIVLCARERSLGLDLLPESVAPQGPKLTVLWSGNETADAGDACVIYVALYGDGRVSARTLDEFEQHVDAPCADASEHTHRVPRFERIGD